MSFSPPANALLRDPFNTQERLPVAQPAGTCVDSENIHDLDLLSSIDIALCRNPQTRATWEQAKSFAANYGQSKSAYLPTVVGDVTGERDFVHGRAPNGIITRSGAQNSYGPGIALNYLLYDFGGRESQVESAKQAMLAAGWNADSQTQALVFQVIQGYSNVFSSSESLEAAKQAEAASKEAYEAAKAKEQVGVVTPADTAQAATAYSQSQLATEKAENALSLAKGTFARILHIQPTADLKLAPLNPDAQNNPFSADISVLIKMALDKRPDLRASAAREKEAEAEFRHSKTLDYPSISFAASSENTNYPNTGGSSVRNSTLELQLSIPLFTGFSNTYQIESARHSLEAARATHAQSEDDISFDVWSSYHNFITAQRNYVTAQALLKSAEASQALTLGRYKEGKGTLIDALNAQAQLADARTQWVQARYNLLVTRYDLVRALGDEELLQSQLQKREEATANDQPTTEVEQPVEGGLTLEQHLDVKKKLANPSSDTHDIHLDTPPPEPPAPPLTIENPATGNSAPQPPITPNP